MKIKNLAATVASGLLVVQMLGVGTAFASSGPSECDFGSDSLEVTLGDDDVTLQIDGDKLRCEVTGGGIDDQVYRSLDSVTVVMDDTSDSDGELTFDLEDRDDAGEAADWPDFDTFDIDVTTTVYVDGSGVTNTGETVRVVIGAKSLSFGGTTVTSNAEKYDIDGGNRPDYIDGSKATADLEVSGSYGADTIKGGAGDDELDGDDAGDTIYGGAGDDDIEGSNGFDVCWAQDGDDYLRGCDIAGPGGGDDLVDTAVRLSYADLTAGMTYTDIGAGISTGGAAGDDMLDGGYTRLYGGAGDDVIVDLFTSDRIYGLGGNDFIKSAGLSTGAFGGEGDDILRGSDTKKDHLYGGPGNDILKGFGREDKLYGGPGKDQTWGGQGIDTCRYGEVMDSCEFIGRV